MRNTEDYTNSVTQLFYSVVMHAVQSKNPEFISGHGRIFYDEENEEYVYSGFTEDELKCVRNAVRELANNQTKQPKAA